MSNRVFLRKFDFDDFEFINDIVSEIGIFELTLANVKFSSKDTNKKFLENIIINNKETLYLVICLKDKNIPIGYLSIKDFDYVNRKVEWGGIIIKNKYSGKGFATEAASLMIDYLFFEQNLHKIYGLWLESNKASINMAKKLGFVQDGILRDEVFKSGEYKNAILMSLIQSEWKKPLNNI